MRHGIQISRRHRAWSSPVWSCIWNVGKTWIIRAKTLNHNFDKPPALIRDDFVNRSQFSVAVALNFLECNE